MKGRIFLVIVLAALVCSVAATSFAETITLRFAQQNPETGLSTVNAVMPWLKQVEDATNGKVKIQAYHSQTLAKGKDMWNATKAGITDIGWCFHGYWPGMTPLSDVVSLPALPFRTAEKGSEVLWKLYEQFPAIQNEYKDVKVLLLYTSEPYHLITRNKPVQTMEDIKGMKIRMTGGPPTEMMKALGGVPVLIPMPDNYISMQKGVIDGMGVPWEAIHVFRFYEVASYYTENVFPAVYFSIAMNKSKWESLPKDVQDAIMTVGGLEGSKFWGRMFMDSMKAETLKTIEAQGQKANMIQLSDKERERWLEVGGKPIWNQWVKDMQAKGFADAQKILDTTLTLSK
jgi:TRAP-type transport system periplasmic protein